MLYIGGDSTKNQIYRYVDTTLDYLKQAPDNPEVKLLALVDESVFSLTVGTQTVEVDSSSVRCYDIKHDSLTEIPLTAINPSFSTTTANMGDGNFLVNFATYCIASYPADYYMLILWGHGTGWWQPLQPVSESISHQKYPAIIYDDHYSTTTLDSTPEYLDVLELDAALSQIKNFLGKPLDILGFDACLMSEIELAYQYRNYANYLLASEELTYIAGWPYHGLLTTLRNNPTLSPEYFLKQAVEIIDRSYSSDQTYPYFIADYDRRSIAALDLTKIAAVATRVSSLASTIKNSSIDLYALYAVRANIEYFGGKDNFRYGSVDLSDLAYLIANCPKFSPEIRQSAQQLGLAVSDCIVKEAHGPAHKNIGGLAINFPRTQDDWLVFNNPNPQNYYQSLAFSQDSSWADFLTHYTTDLSVFDFPNLNYVTVGPNPYNPAAGNFTFYNIPTNASDIKITIYDITGTPVRILDDEQEILIESGKAIWDGKNEYGQTLAPGLYFWQINSSAGSLKGKIAIWGQK